MKQLTYNIKHMVMVGVLAATPLVMNAQAPAQNIKTLITYLASIFQQWLIPMFMTLALIYVILAVIQYIQATEDSQKRAEKRQQIFWGIIGLFVILSVWSLVSIVQNTFNIFGGGNLKPGN